MHTEIGHQFESELSRTPASALELLREATLRHPPEYHEIPPSIRIDEPLPVMAEFSPQPGIQLSIHELLHRYLAHQSLHSAEFASTIIANHTGELSIGPTHEGDEVSVSIGPPLARREVMVGSLLVYRDDIVAASLHTHPNPHSFSLQDLYTGFNKKILQNYVIKRNGVIDMALASRQTHLIDPEVFEKLIDLWGTYLKPDGSFREDLDDQDHIEFLTRVSRDVLHMGFFSNATSNDSRTLARIA